MVEKTSGNQKPLTCSLLFLFSVFLSGWCALQHSVDPRLQVLHEQPEGSMCLQRRRERWTVTLWSSSATTGNILSFPADICSHFCSNMRSFAGKLKENHTWECKCAAFIYKHSYIIYLNILCSCTPFQSLLSLHDSVIINDFDDSEQTV